MHPAVRVRVRTCGGVPSSSGFCGWMGTISMRKSNSSLFCMALAMSFRWSVRRLCVECSAYAHARMLISRMNSSHALANSTGASALIMRTSSSDFMIFLMRASGS